MADNSLNLIRLRMAVFEWRLIYNNFDELPEPVAEKRQRMSDLAAETTRLENLTGARGRDFKDGMEPHIAGMTMVPSWPS